MRYILALIIAVMVGLVLSHTSGPLEAASPQWEDREIDRLLLVISHPDFNQSHNDVSAEFKGAWSTDEQLVYVNGSKWISARYEYITRHNTYLYIGKFKERFEWFGSASGQEINITEKGDVTGLLGDYDFALYTVTKDGNRVTDCVGVVHYYDKFLGPTQDIGKTYEKRVTAVFCDDNASFSHLKNVELQRLINSVGVKKYKLPTLTSMPKKSKDTATSTNITLYCKRSDGSVYSYSHANCGSSKKITKAEYDRLKNKKTDTANDASSTDKASGSSGPLKAKLKEVKDLLDEGLITEEEAAAKRAKLLEDL